MAQLSIRLPDSLADDLRSKAQEWDRSVNALVVDAIEAMVDPANAADGPSELRERLRRAGLLHQPRRRRIEPPDRGELAAARREAGQGKPLSAYVIEGRR